MSWLDLVAYASDAWVLITYAVLARSGRARPFHWANALGAAPLLVVEVTTHAWPVLPLTVTFCTLGWVGVRKTWPRDTVSVEWLSDEIEVDPGVVRGAG